METTESGKVTLVIFVARTKVCNAIAVTPSGMTALPVQPVPELVTVTLSVTVKLPPPLQLITLLTACAGFTPTPVITSVAEAITANKDLLIWFSFA
jgi:hypothetical protein